MNAKTVKCPGCGKSAAGNFCSHCGTPIVSVCPDCEAEVKPGSRACQECGASLVPAAPAPGQPVDLGSMSPREAADRLYNRTMAASEKGDFVEALKFAPMALQAYEGLGTMDNDARYHVALLRLTTEDINGARVQIEMLRQSAPNHLLALMLEHQIAERSGKKDSATRASKAFLVAYDAEMAAGRAEYRDHQGSIERFREAAQVGVTGKK